MTIVARVRAPRDPLSAFDSLYGSEEFTFFCESLGEVARSRYTFFGGRPFRIHRSTAAAIETEDRRTGVRTRDDTSDFVGALRRFVARCRPSPGVSPFSSGAIGYLGYDVVRRFERLGTPPPDLEGLPESVLMDPGEVVVIDRKTGETAIILHEGTTERLREIETALAAAGTVADVRVADGESPSGAGRLESIGSRERFEKGVHAIMEHIRAGDIFQAVLSRRVVATCSRSPLDLYRTLRMSNPAPYMYFLRLGADHFVLGSSPEALVTLEDGVATSRPLAGTRKRSKKVNGRDAEDDRIARELLSDEKERAEHVMLLDLARNDIGRVCDYGSVEVTRQFEVERHAGVMHIVSEVRGRLRADCDAFDLLRAAFPAGTVSGAPKIRAMQILDALEPAKRGLYGGGVGYIDVAGRMDLALAIRTIVLSRGRAIVQAGAGIVADSDPAKEFDETEAKASALFQALTISTPEVVL